MTDKPARTMQLSPYEWRSLVIASVTNLYQSINSAQAADLAAPPNAHQVQWYNDVLDRLKMQVSAWAASGQPVPQVQTRTLPEEEAQEAMSAASEAYRTAANGSGSVAPSGPKKKRGWQKGRKRGPRKPRTDEAVQ